MIFFLIVGAISFESLPTFKISGFLETSWAYFPGWSQKCFKTVLWRLPGLTFRAGARNASELSSEVFWAHFPGYVQQTLCSTNPCSRNPMFNKLYVQQTLCSTHPCSTKSCWTNSMFNKPYVQQTQCSTNLVFEKFRFDKPYVEHQRVWLLELCKFSTVVGHSTKCGVLK